MKRSCLCGLAAVVALMVWGEGLVLADPDKDESGKGREKRDKDEGRGRGGDEGPGGKRGEREKELRKDVDEANRELRKAEEERDRELDKAREEAEREGKPEKYDEKRAKIWSKYRENEAKFRSKLDEKYGRTYEREYDGPREEYRRLPEDYYDERRGGGGGRARDRDRGREPIREGRAGSGLDEGVWVKYADVPAAVQRRLDRERGRYEVKKILRSRASGGREVYRAIIDERGEDRVIVLSSEGRLIDDYRVADVRAGAGRRR